MFPTPNAQQLSSQGMTLAQTAWAQECSGAAALAAQTYYRAGEMLASARAIQCGALPHPALVCLGLCQARLAWLCSCAGDAASSQRWLHLALTDLEAAWRSCPSEPWCQHLLAQTAMVAGRIDLATAVCQSSVGPHLDPVRQALRLQQQRPSAGTPQPGAGNPGWLGWLKQGAAAAKEVKSLLDTFGLGQGMNQRTGGMTSEPQMGWGTGDIGMGWQGGDLGGATWW